MALPDVTVYADDLGGKAPAALSDSVTEFRLAIDFSRPPEEIVASLTLILQESVQTRRWVRRGTENGEAAQ
ncbi:hypothetical protein ACF09I_34360 [Streptomyces sp. NPDC014940]|uniref:hypothetical protein n=1 Tax=Streptomyces sp. NPDC014940 TaxID=3364932 RepID=UPI0036FE3165